MSLEDKIPSEIDLQHVCVGTNVQVRYNDLRYNGAELYKVKMSDIETPSKCGKYVECGTCKIRWMADEKPHKIKMQIIKMNGKYCLLGDVAVRYIQDSQEEQQHLNNRTTNIRLEKPSIPSNVCSCQCGQRSFDITYIMIVLFM